MSSKGVRHEIKVELPAREVLHLSMTVEEGKIVAARLKAVGCLECLRLVERWRPLFKGAVDQVPLPEGSDHASILLRELVMKAQGRWRFPYEEEELCHCRAISTAKVDAAIVGGCHTLEAVRAATSANTSCGACRYDVESVLEYRLKAR